MSDQDQIAEAIVWLDRNAAIVSNLGKPRTDNKFGRCADLIESLAAALRRYGSHLSDCAAAKLPNNCTCGLNDALAGKTVGDGS